ncbi:tripartite tricarboxylate transporter substrate binding protein [Pusillimonas sp. SM2304]|uniref:Bug family tripartite tricarboxylate transporter substrate binding protein n=1 Tax=Pusillimonas sp. SM2304 TaxID=3073241 RepID=UPI002874E1B9|nr:tripartite tricarboxylate transporter substrate binding protein [Pusillimonas sp. SM2304]MDS1139860.1 tripartite tricarboxylate transporter substrate binding protein [Pusillimonas sp. SM2304]
MKFLKIAQVLAVAAMSYGIGTAHAEYPDRPVKMLLPVAAGQSTDIAARLVADELSRKWKQPVYVENKPGGAGIPGMIAGKESPADGYTLIVGVISGMVINPSLFAKLPYDTFNDFTLVTGLFRNPLVVLANPDAPAGSFDELVAEAKKAPGQLSWGFPGVGTTQHLTGELLEYLTKVDIENVYYKGSSANLSDLMGNHISYSVDSIAAALPNIQSGKLKALATTGLARAPQLPDIPTVAELGYKDFEGQGFGGIIFPKGAPEEVIKKVNQDVQEILKTQKMQAAFSDNGLVPFIVDQDEFTKVAQFEHDKWRDVVKRAGIPQQ